jgi:transglutaminase-like putative cysteine protease
MTPAATAAHRRRPARRIPVPGTGDLGPLVMSVSSAVALARLITHGLSARVLLPMAVAIVVGDLVTALGLRARIKLLAAVVVGLLASVVALLVSVDPSSLFNAHLLSAQFHAAQYALANDGTPLPRLNGVVIGVGALGAAAAALTRGFWVRRQTISQSAARRLGPLAPCIAPSFALFIYSTLVSSERGRTGAAVAYFVGVLIFVGLADRRPSGASTPRFPPAPRPTLSAVLSGAVALAVVIGAGVGLSSMKLSVFHVTPPAPPGSSAGANGAPQNLVTGLALVDNLLATEVQTSKVVIFQAQSPAATYWQVGTLSTFNGTQWLPSSGVSDALAGSLSAGVTSLGPPPLPAPTSAATFSATLDITDFASRLLPAPPHTVAVRGLTGATAVGDEGVLAAVASGVGTTYTVTARLTAATPTNGTQLASDDPRLTQYLALPSQPAVVDQLAREAVGQASTPAEKAQALVNWFRNGQFRYTLSPPPTSGPDPLVQFLTVTKAGYCQQFAGAYGVLARALGLPTRLVAGFTAGQATGGDHLTVTGADAHVWPQVYLGPDAGWVSVEPTPPAEAGQAVPDGVLEPTNAAPGVGTVPPAGTAAGSQPAGTSGTTAPPPPAATHAGSVPWLLIALIAVAALALLAAAGLLLRRLRRRGGLGPANLSTDQRVLRSWERATHALRRIGLSRDAAETPGEYAVRVRTVDAEQVSTRPAQADALAQLAALVEQACYTPRPCTPGQAEEAQRLASTIVAAQRRHGANRRHRPARPRRRTAAPGPGPGPRPRRN